MGICTNQASCPNNDTYGEYTLKEDELFVLGDNRGNSFDSRRFGAVGKESLVGRAWIRGWPFDRAQLIKPPEFSL